MESTGLKTIGRDNNRSIVGPAARLYFNLDICLLFDLVLSPLGPHSALVHRYPTTDRYLMYATVFDLHSCHTSSALRLVYSTVTALSHLHTT